MTAMQLSAEINREMEKISDDEALMAKVLKYVKKLMAKREDDTLMTREEFFGKLERGERAYEKGHFFEKLPEESFDQFLKRVG